jgi:hypothetical protein
VEQVETVSNYYVFLDIDGVLLTLIDRSFPSWQTVDALNKITSTTGASIVVSSSWRKAGYNGIKEKLREWGVVGDIAGITPDLSVQDEDTGIWKAVQRGEEIQDWLDRHDPEGHFVILDDETDMAHLAPYLVRTYYEVGLTHVHAQLAIEMLRAR